MAEPVQYQSQQPQPNQVQQYEPQPNRQNQAPMQNVWTQQPGAPTAVMQIQTSQFVTNQPHPRREWSTGLCSCCADFKTCCCAVFCLCCLVCQITARMGECCCVPCLPGGMLAMRTKIRERYRIQGGICKDDCIICWCSLCSICQMDRELNIMEDQGQYCN